MNRSLLADRIATITLWAIALFVVALLAGIIIHFLWASIGTLSIDFLTSDPSDFGVGGIGPLLWNSVYMLVLTLILTVPARHPRRHLHGRVRTAVTHHQHDPLLPGAHQLGPLDRRGTLRARPLR
jgi:hypothetical protein